jgi:hypothetical protein
MSFTNAITISKASSESSFSTILGIATQSEKTVTIFVKISDQYGGLSVAVQDILVSPTKTVNTKALGTKITSTTNIDEKLSLINVVSQGTNQ